MPQVQQHVLNWLYSILTSEYKDVNRTYNDVAQALAQYPTLSPRTDVHTFDNGVSALLLLLSGTIPVVFRGTTYRFPISVWIPHAYPREAPLVYVTPTESMLVRPGQHVDPQGRIYHPYLVGWSTFWDKSTILDFLAILRDIFAKEPPVISRQQSESRPPPAQQTQSPPPVPPLPPDLRSPHTETPPVTVQTGPPAPPPKPSTEPSPPSGPPGPYHDPRDGRPASLSPPAQPLPNSQYGQPATQPVPQHVPSPDHQPRDRQSRYDSAPPLPPPQMSSPHQPGPPVMNPHQRASVMNPLGPQPGQFPGVDPRRMSMPPQPQFNHGPPPGWQPQQAIQQQPKPKAPPPPDIMDQPLMISIPSPPNVPAPPIPPNPEKDALLHQLAQTLYAMRQRTRQQNDSSLAGLAAQRAAMHSASARLQAESQQLADISALLTSNAGILREALGKADAVIEGSRGRAAPDVDALLVAPTVVGNQLYALAAEERAIGDAIFVLGRAVERGRVEPAVFAKTTRSLAREWYLKKALVRKIGRGMGLA